MNWEQKLAKLQELKSNCLRMASPGNWVCDIPGEIGGDGLLESAFGNGAKPSDAVNAAYNIVENLPNHLYVVTTGLSSHRHSYRLYHDNWVEIVPLKKAS